MEIWKDIKGYEGFYQVSNIGRIKSMYRTELTRGRFGLMNRTRQERILKLNKVRDKYFYIELNKNKKIKRYAVHQLVYQAFCGELDCNKIIHHKDKNSLNNHFLNLEQITFKEHNNIHKHVAWNKGLVGYRAGEKRSYEEYNSRRKRVRCIETGVIFNSVSEAAKFVSLKVHYISRALHHKKYRAGEYHYEII